MVTEDIWYRMRRNGAPFSEEELARMSDDEAQVWINDHPEDIDPWAFHGMRKIASGLPIFLDKANSENEVALLSWFHDAEHTYVAMRLLLASEMPSISYLCIHLMHLCIEKGAKALLALQCERSGSRFKPRAYNHRLGKMLADISLSEIRPNKLSVMKAVAKPFEDMAETGKYLVNTAGGQAPGIDWCRPIDIYMKIVWEVFEPHVKAARSASYISSVMQGTAFPGFGRFIHKFQIMRALLWRNDEFCPEWPTVCRELEQP